jgi:hypothetical protein
VFFFERIFTMAETIDAKLESWVYMSHEFVIKAKELKNR